MRYYNTSGDIKLYFVAGTQTVLMTFDIAEAKVKGKDFLGFSISRTDSKNKTPVIMNGSKHFALHSATAHNPSLVQSFFWKDYTADPDTTYTYTVQAMFGTPQNFKAKYESRIKVTTEKLNAGKHSVYFNYGVTGSQAYAKKPFGNQDINKLGKKEYEEALTMLGRELFTDGLMKFSEQAKSKKHSLYCAFFEIQYPPFLAQLKDIKKKAKDLQIIYSGKADQNKAGSGNEAALKKAGLLNKSTAHKRTVPNQPHNKFMVLCEDDEPIEVWTGSTNVTLSGIFGQCNTGHWIKDKAIAKKYKAYWDGIKDNPSKGNTAKVSEKIQPDTDLTKLKDGSYVFFSERDLPLKKGETPRLLTEYAKLIDSAQELVCMVFPFNFDKTFEKVYSQKKKYLRYLLFEKPSLAKQVKAKEKEDPNLQVTGGSVLKSKVEEFAKEVTAKQTVKGGILYVHNKFFLIDPLGENPIVLTGSANFSQPSIKDNDENSVLIKGDARVADIYLTEFNRLFEHFWPRFLEATNKKSAKAPAVGFKAPLDDKYKWFGDHYKKNSYHYKRAQMFIDMKGAKKG